jgi:hypothetical protein
LRRRPRPKLGCGAKERRKRRMIYDGIKLLYNFFCVMLWFFLMIIK